MIGEYSVKDLWRVPVESVSWLEIPFQFHFARVFLKEAAFVQFILTYGDYSYSYIYNYNSTIQVSPKQNSK